MATLEPNTLTDTFKQLLGDWGFFPSPATVQHSIEMEKLADLLHQTERQLNRARIQHLCEAISLRQLQALWQQKIPEVQQLVQKVPLEPGMLDSWSRRKIAQAMESWESVVAATSERSLQVLDFCSLQGALEEISNALFICARVERGQVGPA
jgi:hypothetical protein